MGSNLRNCRVEDGSVTIFVPSFSSGDFGGGGFGLRFFTNGWSVKRCNSLGFLGCFEIGWPMHVDHDFFCVCPTSDGKNTKWRTSFCTRKETKTDRIQDREMGSPLDEIRKPK